MGGRRPRDRQWSRGLLLWGVTQARLPRAFFAEVSGRVVHWRSAGRDSLAHLAKLNIQIARLFSWHGDCFSHGHALPSHDGRSRERTRPQPAKGSRSGHPRLHDRHPSCAACAEDHRLHVPPAGTQRCRFARVGCRAVPDRATASRTAQPSKISGATASSARTGTPRTHGARRTESCVSPSPRPLSLLVQTWPSTLKTTSIRTGRDRAASNSDRRLARQVLAQPRRCWERPRPLTVIIIIPLCADATRALSRSWVP